jgi:hypothetical protein
MARIDCASAEQEYVPTHGTRVAVRSPTENPSDSKYGGGGELCPMSQPKAAAGALQGAPQRVIQDAAIIRCAFNVMSGREVEETFFVREYRIWHRYIEAEFDRTYVSQMANSPSHVVFLTALTHTQKMLYVYMCHELGFDYQPDGPELLKLWPTKIDVRMPTLVTSEKGIVHRLHLSDVRRYSRGRFKMFIDSHIDGVISICGECPGLIL